MFCSFILWIIILSYDDPGGINEIMSNGFFGWWHWMLPKALHVFVSDIIPLALAYFCTYISIHLDGKVGVLDTENFTGLYVRKKSGGKVRRLSDEEVYEMNKEDPDRVFYDLDIDNEVIDAEIDFRKTHSSFSSKALREKAINI